MCKKSIKNSQPFVRKMRNVRTPWGDFFLTHTVDSWRYDVLQVKPLNWYKVLGRTLDICSVVERKHIPDDILTSVLHFDKYCLQDHQGKCMSHLFQLVNRSSSKYHIEVSVDKLYYCCCINSLVVGVCDRRLKSDSYETKLSMLNSSIVCVNVSETSM